MGKHIKDTGLVKKAMRGNPKAFGALVEREQDYLYRIAFLCTRNQEDALDAVQEGIIKAYQGIRTLRDPGVFQTWLTRIVINTARDLCRKKRPEQPLEEREDFPQTEDLSAEDRMDLYRALEDLPEKYRDVVRLKYFDGLTIREIAGATGMPEGTVSVYLRRALKELQGQLKEETVCTQN